MGLVEVLLTIALTIGGAILERESNGQVTVYVGYSDSNLTRCVPCKLD